MEHVLDDVVPAEDLKKFEQKYHEEINTGKVGKQTLKQLLIFPN